MTNEAKAGGTWTPPTVPAPPQSPLVIPSGVWVPSGTTRAGVGRPKILMNVVGPSGVGKSWLVNQLGQDPDYGPENVLVLMHEDGTASYGNPLPARRSVTTFKTAEAVLDEILAAAAKAPDLPLPKILVWDSLTGATDYTQSDFGENPNMVWSDDKKQYVRDKRSEYGDLGAFGRDIYLKLRMLPMDVVVMITSHEGAFSPIPEIACEGKLIPKNVTRWSSCTLYMKAIEAPKASPEEVAADIAQYGIPAHRTYGKDANGNYDGTYINRFFITQNTGEITAKGHVSLGIRERAILPEVLRKIRNYSAKQAG